MINHNSGVHGMIATVEKVVIPSTDDVLKVGRERSVGILTVVLKNVDSVSSGLCRFELDMAGFF